MWKIIQCTKHDTYVCFLTHVHNFLERQLGKKITREKMLRNAANLIGAIAALSFLILASCMPNYTSELPGKQGEISSTMRYMGGVDGKHFFMDRSHYMVSIIIMIQDSSNLFHIFFLSY